MEDITLIHGDAIVELKKIKNNSIDCVITDPPYFMKHLDDSWNTSTLIKEKANSHITHLPKGMKFDKKQTKNLYTFYNKLCRILYQKIKPGGFFLSFSAPRLYHSLATAVDDAGFEIRDMINWVYSQSFPKGMGVQKQIARLSISDEKKKRITRIL